LDLHVLLALPPLGEVIVGLFDQNHVASHTTGVVLSFQLPVVSFLVTGLAPRRNPSWRRTGNGLLLASLLTFILAQIFVQVGAPGAPLADTGLGGLAERIVVLNVQAWFAALGWWAHRHRQPATGQPGPTSP
jgi:hypothetical protein